MVATKKGDKISGKSSQQPSCLRRAAGCHAAARPTIVAPYGLERLSTGPVVDGLNMTPSHLLIRDRGNLYDRHALSEQAAKLATSTTNGSEDCATLAL